MTGWQASMQRGLTLTFAEEMTLASALRLERESLSSIRGNAERYLAMDDRGGAPDWTAVDWSAVASRMEKGLATLDGLLAKLPEWVGRTTRAS